VPHPGGEGTGVGQVGLRLTGANPARSRVALLLEVSAPLRVHVAVFDVMGRRVRTLVDGEIPAGTSPLVWDGRGAARGSVGSGVYFIRLSCARGQRLVRVPLLRSWPDGIRH